MGKEQFFTTEPLVRRCVDAVERLYGAAYFGWCVEPGAGDGAFLAHLPEGRCTALDVEPLAEGIERADFLAWAPPSLPGPVLTIGNPPFGPRGALAMRFLRKACGYSDVVAFILPRSFGRESLRQRVDRRFHLVESFDCEAFRVPTGQPRRVRAVFQVWEKRATERALELRPATHPDFELKHCHLSRVPPEQMAVIRRTHAFAIPQVGTSFRPRDAEAITAGSHWFVRALRPGVRELFERLDFGFLAGRNTTFTSLARRDIVQAYVTASGRIAG